MYKKISIVLALIIIALVAYFSFYTTEKKIGVINMNQLLKESSRAAQLQNTLSQKGEELEEKYIRVQKYFEEKYDKIRAWNQLTDEEAKDYTRCVLDKENLEQEVRARLVQ